MCCHAMTRILISTCATQSYTYALPALLRAIQRNIYVAKRSLPDVEFHVLLIGDSAILPFEATAARLMPDVEIHVFKELKAWTEHKNYKPKAQQVIAQMRSTMFEEARAMRADFLWSLDSDVLPPDNALLCSHQMLAFDGSYYAIAACPYPSQGGGSFLTGRGDHRKGISANWEFDELELSEELSAEWKALCEKMDALNKGEDRDAVMEVLKERAILQKKIEKECPPKHKGNVFKLNAEFGWKKRGWFDYAYPAIGKGAVVPVEWCGFGATYCDARAIAATDFTGYECRGTEDLYIIWKRWAAQDLRICSIPHCPCDHIVRIGAEKKIMHEAAFHETTGDMKGHLRRRRLAFFQHSVGEPPVDIADDEEEDSTTEKTKEKEIRPLQALAKEPLSPE